MIVDDILLNKLEKLSALKVSDDRRDEIKSQLNEIVNFVEILNELDLSDIKATISTINGGTPFREDVPKKSDVIEVILNNAPSAENGFFVVPKIIE